MISWRCRFYALFINKILYINCFIINIVIYQIKTMEKSIKDDEICAICLELLYLPQKLDKCTHIFCKLCLSNLKDQNNNPVCPKCRSPFNKLIQMKQLHGRLQKDHPEEFKLRKQLYENQLQFKPLIFLFGNTAKKADKEKDYKYDAYEWKFFFTMEGENPQKYVERITIKLHPTFAQSTIRLTKAPFEIVRIGWGVFNIQFQVEWKQIVGKGMSVHSHYLCFNQPKTQTKLIRKYQPKEIKQ